MNEEFKVRNVIFRTFFCKTGFLAVLFFLAVSFSASAYMVSFYVVEAGLPEHAENRQQTDLWENAFLDVFFDAGHIVCNAPVLRLDAKPSGDIMRAVSFSLQDARDGGIEYILITMLDYTPNLMSANEITFYIYNTSTRQILFEKKISGKSYKTAKEETDDIKSIVRGLVPYIRD